MPAKTKPDCICSLTHETADALKALGHPVRLQMVRELVELQTCCCADLCKCFPQSQSTISQHLSVLKDADIVSFEKDGNKSCFSLNYQTLKAVQAALHQIIAQDIKAEND